MTVERAIAVILLVAMTWPGLAAERRRVTLPPPDDSLSIAFVEAESNDGSMLPAGSDAWLDMKSVARMDGSNEKVIRRRHRFGVKVVRVGGMVGGTAAVSVRLDSWDGRATYRLDGRPLAGATTVVDAHAPVGTVVFHTLDVEVPVSIAEGPLAASITWEVTTE